MTERTCECPPCGPCYCAELHTPIESLALAEWQRWEAEERQELEARYNEPVEYLKYDPRRDDANFDDEGDYLQEED